MIKVFIIKVDDQTDVDDSFNNRIINIHLEETLIEDYPTYVIYNPRYSSAFVFTNKGFLYIINIQTAEVIYSMIISQELNIQQFYFSQQMNEIYILLQDESINKIKFNDQIFIDYIIIEKEIPSSLFTMNDYISICSNKEFNNVQLEQLISSNNYTAISLMASTNPNYKDICLIRLLKENNKKFTYLFLNQMISMKNIKFNEIETIIFCKLLIENNQQMQIVQIFIDNLTITKNVADRCRKDIRIAMKFYDHLKMYDNILELCIENEMYNKVQEIFQMKSDYSPNWINIIQVIIEKNPDKIENFINFLRVQDIFNENLKIIIKILCENQMYYIAINFILSLIKRGRQIDSETQTKLIKLCLLYKPKYGLSLISNNICKDYDKEKIEQIKNYIISKNYIYTFLDNLVNVNSPIINTIQYYMFKNYFEKQNYESASKFLLYNSKLCIFLSSSQYFMNYLITNSLTDIIHTIYFVYKKYNLNIQTITNPNDFILACKYCTYPIIAIHGHNESSPYYPINFDSEQYESALKVLLDRDDPELLINCLNDLNKLIAIEANPITPLYYVIKGKKVSLLKQMWIIIKPFDLNDHDLLLAYSYWKHLYPNEKPPFYLERTLKKHILNVNFKIVSMKANDKIPLNNSISVTDYHCLNVSSIFLDANKLFSYLLNRINRYNLEFNISPVIMINNRYLIMQLPCLFLADSNALIHPKLYTEVTPIGEEATGTGPVQDLFNSYFKELSKLDIFDVDENTTMILPTAAASASKERIDEIERIFYGLGVVFLKTLIDMRQMGGVNDVNNKKMPTELIFPSLDLQALSWKFSSNTKHLLNESLLYDYKFAEFLSSAKESNNIEFIKYEVTTNKLFLFNRKLFFRAIYDGFNLNYRRGFLPKSFKTEMEKSKKELTEFYKIINSISPESVQLLIVGSPRIHAHVLLDKFIFQAYEGVDLSGEGSDKLMDLSKSPQNAKLFEKVKNIFRNYIKKLCDKPQQTKIKRFLSYLFGVPSFSPLMHEKWLFAVSFYSRAKFLDAFACDRFVIVPMFDSEKELDEIVNNTLINHEKDAVSRDVIYARQVHDTFDPKNE